MGEIEEKRLLYRKEIRASLNPLLFKTLARTLVKPVMESAFTEIKEENLDYVKEASKRGTIVYASNHKSYADPPLLGLVLYKNGLKRPLYAAGKNMFRGWSSWFLKSLGAFSVDRNNKDPVYLNEVKDYVSEMLSQQRDIVLYIEGGRSYDGRMKSPKLGILKAVLESKNRDVFILPTAISYEQTLEDMVLTGIGIKTKQRKFSDEAKELFRDYLNYYSTPVNGRKHYSTKAYVSFSKPISMRDYGKTRKDLKNLAESVIRGIKEAKHPSSTSLVSYFSLKLAGNGNTADISKIEKEISSSTQNNCVLREGLGYLLSRGIIARHQDIIIIREPRLMEYYANGLN